MSYPKRDRAYVNRLSSFEPGFCPVSNEALALAGFRYEGPGDQVRCDYCQGRFKSWREGDDPLEEHKEHFKGCPFLRPLLVFPKHPEFTNRPDRIDTFADRQRTNPSMSPSPAEFSDCGFFSYPATEDNDSVTCYYCGVTLARWSPGDDVWKEHVKNKPACAFIVLDKGAEFLVTGPYASFIPQFTQSRRTTTSEQDERRRSLGSSPTTAPANSASIAPVPPPPPSGHESRSFVPVQVETPRPDTPPRSSAIASPPLITDIPLNRPPRNHPSPLSVSRSNSANSPHPNRYSPISVSSLRNAFSSEFMSPSPIRNISSSPSGGLPRHSPSFPTQRAINSRRSPILLSQNRISPYTIPNRNSINHRAPEPLPENFEVLTEDERRQYYDVLRRQHECKVCLSNLATVCFLPCRHLSACPACAPQLENCHVCRQRIREVIDVFLS